MNATWERNLGLLDVGGTSWMRSIALIAYRWLIIAMNDGLSYAPLEDLRMPDRESRSYGAYVYDKFY